MTKLTASADKNGESRLLNGLEYDFLNFSFPNDKESKNLAILGEAVALLKAQQDSSDLHTLWPILIPQGKDDALELVAEMNDELQLIEQRMLHDETQISTLEAPVLRQEAMDIRFLIGAETLHCLKSFIAEVKAFHTIWNFGIGPD